MAASLTKPIKRNITVYGISYPVVAIFGLNGIEMSLHGFKTKVYCRWEDIVRKAMNTPGNVSSVLAGDAFKFLKDQQLKLAKKLEAKAKK